MTFSLPRRLTAEALGTAFLLAIVVGSGIMAEDLSAGNEGLALLANAIATGAGLTVLILIFSPISGAHFNPAVSFAFFLKREITTVVLLAYIAAQIAGAFAGVAVTHLMFELPIAQVSTNARAGMGQGVAEALAAFGLVFTILACARFRPEMIAATVGLFITAGYWFTASTSFANPAVALARMMTDTFTGIRPVDVPLFIIAEFAGAALAVGFAAWLLKPARASGDGALKARYSGSYEEGPASAV